MMTSVFSLLGTAAWAQAGRPPAASPASPDDSWTGVYVGANVGHVSNTFSGPINFAAVVSGGTTFPAESLDFGSVSAGSGIIGIQAGYGIHLTRTLIGGLEVQLTHTSATAATQAGVLPASAAFFIPGDTRTTATGLMTSIRGRAGTTMMPGLLVYGTVGVAMTKVTVTGEFPATTVAGTAIPEANGFETRTMKGLTIGAGAEYAPWKRGNLENLTIGAEFRHAALGTQSFALANVQVTVPAASSVAVAVVDASANEFEIRVNYRFSLRRR
jgi:opacity protein-like surface antigen